MYRYSCLVQHDQNFPFSLWVYRLPENNVSSLVGFPCLDQSKVSSDGLFHDVVPAIELSHLYTMTTQLSQVSGTEYTRGWT